MNKTRNPHADVAPTFGNYVRAVRAGNAIYVAGCTAARTPAENDDVIAQADATLNRIQAIVNAEGAAMSDVVRLVVYVTDMDAFRPRQPEFEVLMERYFQGQYPTSTLVATPALAFPNLLIEIEPTIIL